MTTRTLHRPGLWGLVAVLGLGAAGCGGDKDGTPTDTDTTPDETADTGTTPTTETGTTTMPDVEVSDPLSMPLVPTLDLAMADSAKECETCHETHVEEWSQSLHSYAIHDPIYQAIVAVRQADYEGMQDRFCLQCHTTLGSRGGEVVAGFSFDDFSPVSDEGVTCVSCHKIDSVERTNNAGHTLDLAGPMLGPIADPDPSAFHESEASPLFQEQSPELCGSCHDVIEVSGLNLERPYEEYLESPAYAAGTRCADCHMPYKGDGPVVQGGKDRPRHDHRFIGVDVPLAPGTLTPEQEERLLADTTALLQGSVQLEVLVPESVERGKQLDVVLDVTNLIDAHNFPTGSTFIRQSWLEVVATDATGRELYSTGTLDDNGDLRNAFSDLDPYGDDDLIVFTSSLVDIDGNPEIFSWRAEELWHNSLQPLHTRVFTLFIPTGEAIQGPISVDARIRFRTHGPYLLRALGLDELLPRLHIVDIDATHDEVELILPGTTTTTN